jgi:hypothetical protein
LPTLEMLRSGELDLEIRAKRIVSALAEVPVAARIGRGKAQIGGGTLPRSVIPSVAVELQPMELSLKDFAAQLRQSSPPLIGYVANGRFKFDLRTIFPHQDADVEPRHAGDAHHTDSRSPSCVFRLSFVSIVFVVGTRSVRVVQRLVVLDPGVGLDRRAADPGAEHCLLVRAVMDVFRFDKAEAAGIAADGARVVESTTPFTSGASGGALFDAQGRLVGILTYRLRGDRRSYFSVPVEWFLPRLTGGQAYAAVAPLDGAQPFWQRPPAVLPFFLRAHQLETSGDWDGLLNLTDAWSKADDTNAEAWVFRGRSLVETQHLAAAQLALQHAVALDPVSSTAWLQLGRLSAHRGLTEEAEDALAQLNRLNPELAQCLAVEMHPAPDALQPPDPVLDACSAL